MKLSDIPFNMEFEVGEDLKEVPLDPGQMQKGTEWIKEKMAEKDISLAKSAVLMGHIGVFCRILGDLEQSELMLKEALVIFENEELQPQIIQTEIRLASTYHWMKNYKGSTELLLDSIKKINKSSDAKSKKFLDFSYQHLGKLKLEQGFLEVSLDYFMKALETRVIKGEVSLVESTEKALTLVKKLIEEKNNT